MDEEERYVDEFGQPLERYWPKEPGKRGRHKTFQSALQVAVQSLLPPEDPFFDVLVDEWGKMFPDSPLRPGRRAGTMIFLYAPNSAVVFAERPHLPKIKRRLAKLPGAPQKFTLKLEVKR